MDDKTSELKLYIMSFVFSAVILLSYKIVGSGFKNLVDISFKVNHLGGFLLLLLAVFYLLKKKYLWNVKKSTKSYLFFVSVFFSVLNVLGAKMAYTNVLFSGSTGDMTILTFCLAGYFISFYGIASILLYSFNSGFLFMQPITNNKKYLNDGFLWSFFFTTIILFWLIWIIAYYPATVDYDAEMQLCSYLGFWSASNNHPWFSTCVIGVLFDFGRNLMDDNFGMFLYIILRALCMALIYSRCILLLKKAEIRNSILIVVLLFYAITPVWGAYAKQPFKDTFAAALFCWYITQTVVLIRGLIRNDKPDATSCLLYSLSGVLSALFRHNYFYVMLLTTIIITGTFFKRKCPWKYMVVIFTGIFIYAGFNYYILTYGGVKAGMAREMFSLPFQQTARTVKYHGGEMSNEEKQNINRLLDFNLIGKVYDPVISDPVKNTVKTNATKKDSISYFKTWFSQLFQYPVSYIEATIAGTYGYYAFTKDGYPSGGLGNCGMVILKNINKDTKAKFDKYFNFNYCNRFKSLRIRLEMFTDKWHKTPIANLTDTIPLYTWFVVIIIMYMLIYRKGVLVIPALATALTILTCIASPVNGSFRYFAGVAAAMPVLLLTLKDETETK